jgi:hypothetical protein
MRRAAVDSATRDAGDELDRRAASLLRGKAIESELSAGALGEFTCTVDAQRVDATAESFDGRGHGEQLVIDESGDTARTHQLGGRVGERLECWCEVVHTTQSSRHHRQKQMAFPALISHFCCGQLSSRIPVEGESNRSEPTAGARPFPLAPLTRAAYIPRTADRSCARRPFPSLRTAYSTAVFINGGVQHPARRGTRSHPAGQRAAEAREIVPVHGVPGAGDRTHLEAGATQTIGDG